MNKVLETMRKQVGMQADNIRAVRPMVMRKERGKGNFQGK